ncbi:MAG: ABC transporter permease, partial [Bacteroidales bacterium]|nr:ABC transporter permease [Bacteroidales bacterium]
FATAIFATLLSSFYTDSESVNLIVPFFSVGLIFISGISFPREAMPLFWQATYYLLPCAPAITGYIKLNSMGADIVAASHEIYTLVAQCFIYGTILYTVCKTKKAGPTDQPSDYLL